MPAAATHFTSALFDFLRAMAKNNPREWFLENKNQHDPMRDAMLKVIATFAP